MLPTYNHAFTIAFSISGSKSVEGEDVKPSQIREAILTRLAGLDDEELMEAVGMPFDTYEEEDNG